MKLDAPQLNAKMTAVHSIARDHNAVNVESIPLQLRALPQWVCWKYITRDGKPTKCPFNARNGHLANSTDAATWASFEEAVAAYHTGGYSGIGFVFSEHDPFCGIDLDDCIDESGEIVPAARALIEFLDAYTEISPSGRGVKIFIRGHKPEDAGCKSKAIAGFKETEIYDQDRFFTVTGRHVEGTPRTAEDRQEELNALCARLWPPKPDLPTKPEVRTSEALESDETIIERLRRARNGPKFSALFDRGEISGHGNDRNRADLALCCLIAFCTRDPAQIERIFSMSALGQRDKWKNRSDYRERTIAAALAFIPPPPPLPPQRRGSPRILSIPSREDGEVVDYECTDLGNAERFAARCRDHLRYCHALGVWLVWDGTRWREDQVGKALLLAGETARSILEEASAANDTGRRKELSNWSFASEHRGRLDAMLTLAKSQPALAVTAAQLDADQWLLNTSAGTLDLRTGLLRPHRREDLITKLAPVQYDPQATCPRWDEFLLRILAGDQSIIGYLARFFGYSLCGEIELQYLPILQGVGSNGKSVFMDTIKGIMGDYACDAPPSLLVKTGRDEHPTEIADLLGRRLVVASETEEGAVLKLQLVKRLTGDATLKGRRMRENFFEFPRTHKTVLVTNNVPRVRENSHAVWRRLHLVPFKVVIPEDQCDPKLLGALREEWPGILAWLVRGGIACHTGGLKPPPVVVAATSEYRVSEDAVGRFLDERCVIDPEGTPPDRRAVTTWKVIFSAYTAWCDSAGEMAVSSRRLGEALDKRGVTSETQWVDGKSCKVRIGLKLRGGEREE